MSIDKDELARMALERATAGGVAILSDAEAAQQILARERVEVWTLLAPSPGAPPHAGFRNVLIAGFAGDGMAQLVTAIATAAAAATAAIRTELKDELLTLRATAARVENLHDRLTRLAKRIGTAGSATRNNPFGADG
jgi:hypothetical protein